MPSLRLRTPLFALLAAGLAVVGLAGPAGAHDRLVSTDPADGATVEAVPAALTLTFSEAVLGEGAEVRVTADGADVGAGTPAVTDAVVSVPLPPDAPNGAYAVQWRVVSADGHPVEGTFAFTLAAPAAAPTPPAPTEEPVATPSDLAATADAATPTAGSPDATAQVTTPAPLPGEAGGLGSAVPWIVVAVLLVGGFAVLLARRNGGFDRRNGPPGQH